MKLKRRSNTKVLLIAGIVALVLIVAVVALLIVNGINEKKEEQAKEEGKAIHQIIMSSYPDKTVYNVGETFNPVGAKIQVITKGQIETYFVDYNELTFEGFDSSEAKDAVTITVSYKGFKTSFNVKIKEVETTAPVLERIEVYNFQTEYEFNAWNEGGPDTAGGKIRAYYSDGSIVEGIVLKTKYIPGYDQLSKPGKTTITVQYSDGVTTVETTVEITVTN